jgi:uncharacterized protein YjdB
MRRRSLLASLILLTAAACSDDGVVQPAAGNPVQQQSSQVASVVIAPQTVLLTLGDTVRLIASTRDVSGSPLPGRVVAWSSESPEVVSVSSTGLVTALVAGRSVRIRALSEGTTGVATVTIGN